MLTLLIQDDELNFKSRESSGGDLPYTLKRELERRRIKSSRKSRFSAADSEESFDDGSDLRLRSVTSGSSGGSYSSKRRQRRIRRPEETHF